MNDNSNKRAHYHHLQPSSNNPPPPPPSNKRRKKNNTNNHNKHKNKKQSYWSGAHSNWIENCSDTANRVLSKDFTAPLLCLITRAEIGFDDENDEKVVVNEVKKPMPQLPLPSSENGRGELVDHNVDAGVGRRSSNAGDDNYDHGGGPTVASPANCCITAAETATKVDCSSAIHDAEQVDVGDVEYVAPTATAVEVQSCSAYIASMTASISTSVTSKSIDHTISNIAWPSTSFLLQYARERVPFEVLSTIRGDGDAQEKRIFIPVKRHASAIGPTKWVQLQTSKAAKMRNQIYHHLPNGDNGDGICNPYPTVPNKFWAQRKLLFSRYDEGIRIGGEDGGRDVHDVEQNDEQVGLEMWYSVTPEAIANHIADRMVKMILTAWNKNENAKVTTSKSLSAEESNDGYSHQRRDIIILDAFCGCGGNSLAFARWNERHTSLNEADGGHQQHEYRTDNDRDADIDRSPRVKVIAVENNLSRLKMAAHNASVYNVPRENIVFIHADAVEVLNHYSHGSTRSTARNDDCGSSGSGNCKQHHGSEASYAGFAVGGMDLLPNNIDGIFLSPPWGGMDYNQAGKAGFDPVTSITVQSCASSVHEPDGKVEGTASYTPTTVTTNGGELLHIATKAVYDDANHEGVVAYFLPRNVDGIALGKIAVACDIKGCYEMEQNVVNGKVKTVTAYFGQDFGNGY